LKANSLFNLRGHRRFSRKDLDERENLINTLNPNAASETANVSTAIKNKKFITATWPARETIIIFNSIKNSRNNSSKSMCEARDKKIVEIKNSPIRYKKRGAFKGIKVIINKSRMKLTRNRKF